MSWRVALVGCCGPKLDHPAPVRDLYLSPLFRAARAWSERNCDAWAVLSARHGLVFPDDVIAPYDLHLRDLSSAAQAAWGARTNRQIRAKLFGAHLVFLAGRTYAAAVRGLPDVEMPLNALSFGFRLRWFARA